MVILFPILIAAGLMLACNSEKETDSPHPPIEPKDLVIGPEPPPRVKAPTDSYSAKTVVKTELGEKKLGQAGLQIMENFRGSLDQKKTFQNLTAAQQSRVDRSSGTDSLHKYFIGMLNLGNYFEMEGRKDVATKIYQTLQEPLFPVADLIRTEAGIRLSDLSQGPQ